MLWGIKYFLRKFLQEQNLFWNKGVDLGCGWGDALPILRRYVTYLVGVDVEESFLKQAKGYDELVLSDIRKYDVPYDATVIFLFDVIEHLPRRCAEILLAKISFVPNILITTPQKYYQSAGEKMRVKMTHLSSWTKEDFSTRGYTTTTFMAGMFLNLFPQPIIFAFKLEERL